MSETLRKSQEFVFRGLLAINSLRQLESTGVYLRDAHKLGSVLADLTFAEFSPQINDGAERMSRLYVAFFCFENSVRELVAQKLRDSHGDGWWEACVPGKLKDKVEARKKQEERNKWHQPRSRANINYTDFGDMPAIILNNWSCFEDLFDTQEWVKARFGDMEKSRNVIAHNNVLVDDDVERIRLYLQDWARIVGL